MPTLQLNPTEEEPIVLDASCTQWLTVIERHSDRRRTCAVPQKYFDVLKTWGLVKGTFATAELSPSGRTRLIEERAAEAKKPKPKKKKK
jgi:hypothetical protein